MNNQSNNAHNEHVGSPQSSQGGSGSRVLVVKAIHEFKPVNIDELAIKPGDQIVITNPEEGGWWEGTLGSKTGWFPSNFVEISDFTPDKTEEMGCADEYRNLIVSDLIETEKAYGKEMDEFFEFLKTIGGVVKCQDPIVSKFSDSFFRLISAHKVHILGPLVSGGVPRLGKVFMDAAGELSGAHTSYTSLHPKFVQYIERNQEKLTGPDQTGVLRIIKSLSAPFRRIEKYSKTLEDYLRYVEEYSGDRGDLQRGVKYYRNLEKTLTSLRKQKEMELEVLTPGAIKDFEGPDVTGLGDVLLMNLLFVGRDKQARYFVLFSNCILILCYDNVGNMLTYKGRIYISGVTVSCCDGDDSVSNAFEISGPTLHTLLVQCPTPAIRTSWLRALNELLRTTRCYSTGTTLPQQHQIGNQQSGSQVGSIDHVIGGLSPPVQAWNIARLRPSAPYNPFLHENLNKSGLSIRSSSSSGGFEKGSSFKFKSGSFSGGVAMGAGGVSNEEDLCVLGIVDGFCGQNKRSVSGNPVQQLNLNNKINGRVLINSNYGGFSGGRGGGVYGQVNQNVNHNNRSLPQQVCNLQLQRDIKMLNDKFDLVIELVKGLKGGDLRNGNL